MFNKLKNYVLQEDYWHGKQSVGNLYSVDNVSGYYNDLTKKVIRAETTKIRDIVPLVSVGNKKYIHPVTVCQVGLGAYDLFLLNQCDIHKDQVLNCCNWLYDNSIKFDVGVKWIVPFEFKLFKLESGFHSSLIQGQAMSLLCRGYLINNDKRYLDLAREAFDFLILPKDEGGCRVAGTYLFEEYPTQELNLVLNGYISTIWGVFDLMKISKEVDVEYVFNSSIDELVSILPFFNSRIWSRYCLKPNCYYYSNLASPYYHREHIEQLKVMADISHHSVFNETLKTWENKSNNYFNVYLVIVIKGISVLIQKVLRIR